MAKSKPKSKRGGARPGAGRKSKDFQSAGEAIATVLAEAEPAAEPAKISANGLSPKQERFVSEYLIDMNGTQAAIRAGYSVKTATQQGSRLLMNDHVAAEVSKRRAKLASKLEVTAERVLGELTLLGFSNMLDYVQPRDDGFVHLDLSALTREQAAAIQEVTIDSYEERDPDGGEGDTRTVKKVKFKLTDKRAALVEIGKHLGMFKDKLEVTGKDGGPIVHEVKRVIVDPRNP